MCETNAKLQELMSQFAYTAQNQLETAKQWKAKNGGKVVGYVGLDIPEEIIHAAGMLPVAIFEKDAPIVKANAHVQNFMCGYIRSVADQALTGDLSFLDCLVIHDSCHVIRMIGDLLRVIDVDLAKIEFLYFPATLKNKRSWDYLLEELNGFAARMEKTAGKKISDQDIRDSIAVYNKNRLLLQKFYRLRRENPGLVTAVEVANVVKSGMLMPKEEHSAMLEELLKLLELKKKDPRPVGIPIIISGSLCEVCDSYIPEILEQAGAVIVDDDLYVGSRYFNTMVSQDKPPVEALAHAYVNRVAPCPTRYDPQNQLGDYLAKMAKDANAKGIVNVIVKYCEAHYYAYFLVHQKLREMGIPEFMIETEHEIASFGQAKTRLQGFLESLGE